MVDFDMLLGPRQLPRTCQVWRSLGERLNGLGPRRTPRWPNPVVVSLSQVEYSHRLGSSNAYMLPQGIAEQGEHRINNAVSGPVSQQDNAPVHTATIAKAWFERYNV